MLCQIEREKNKILIIMTDMFQMIQISPTMALLFINIEDCFPVYLFKSDSRNESSKNCGTFDNYLLVEYTKYYIWPGERTVKFPETKPWLF